MLAESLANLVLSPLLNSPHNYNDQLQPQPAWNVLNIDGPFWVPNIVQLVVFRVAKTGAESFSQIVQWLLKRAGYKDSAFFERMG